MAGFILKLILFPLTLILCDYIFPQVNYGNMFQAAIIGIILAVLAQSMDVILLRSVTFVTSFIFDYIAAILVVFYASKIFSNAQVNFTGALLSGIFLSIIEYFLHIWLIGTGRIKNRAH